MAFETASKAVSFMGSNLKLLRFAGGEPLTDFSLFLRIMEILPPSTQVRLTTNGLLLKDAILDRLESDGRISLVLSVDGKRATHTSHRRPANSAGDSYSWFEEFAHRLSRFSRPVTMNVVISPGEAHNLVENIAFLASKGFYRFNLLPAYFCHWQQDQLADLQKQLRLLAAFFDQGLRKGIPFSVVNVEHYSAQPLFTDSLVVDIDGSLFDNDIIVSHFFSKDKKTYSLGNILTDASLNSAFLETGKTNWPALIEEKLPPDIVRSTQQVDNELNLFVGRLQCIFKD